MLKYFLDVYLRSDLFPVHFLDTLQIAYTYFFFQIILSTHYSNSARRKGLSLSLFRTCGLSSSQPRWEKKIRDSYY